MKAGGLLSARHVSESLAMIPRRKPKRNTGAQLQSRASFPSSLDFAIDEPTGAFMLDAAFNNQIDNANQEKLSWRNLDCYT